MDAIFIKISDTPGDGVESVVGWIEKTKESWNRIIPRVLEFCKIPDVFKEAGLWNPLTRISDQQDIVGALQRTGNLTIVSSNGSVDVKLVTHHGPGVSVAVDYNQEVYHTSEIMARALLQAALTYTQIEDGKFNSF